MIFLVNLALQLVNRVNYLKKGYKWRHNNNHQDTDKTMNIGTRGHQKASKKFAKIKI